MPFSKANAEGTLLGGLICALVHLNNAEGSSVIGSCCKTPQCFANCQNVTGSAQGNNKLPPGCISFKPERNANSICGSTDCTTNCHLGTYPSGLCITATTGTLGCIKF